MPRLRHQHRLRLDRACAPENECLTPDVSGCQTLAGSLDRVNERVARIGHQSDVQVVSIELIEPANRRD